MTFGSLFAGIGGMDSGLESAGMECKWQCEIEPSAIRILQKHWPNVPKLNDIRSMLWPVAFPAKTFQGPAQPPTGLMASVLACGGKCYESFAWYDQSTSSWRTWQQSWTENGWERFLGPWPRLGLMRNGIAYRLKSSALPTNETGSLRLPTPTKSMGKRGWGISQTGRRRYSQGVQDSAMSFGYKPHARVIEWMMGFPQDFTLIGSEDSETPSCHKLPNG